MVQLFRLLPALALCAATLLSGCGLAYNAGARVRTSRMLKNLKPGESSIQVHQDWGEPDLRENTGPHTEVWSYAAHPNTNDITATLLYTSTKPGDTGKFLDLKFIDGKLVSWNEAQHTIPAKQGSGFSYGVGPGGVSNVSHY
jgi:outer membrane protein assembly factor BamE (lipoprotein component of BamABCDE complex)